VVLPTTFPINLRLSTFEFELGRSVSRAIDQLETYYATIKTVTEWRHKGTNAGFNPFSGNEMNGGKFQGISRRAGHS